MARDGRFPRDISQVSFGGGSHDPAGEAEVGNPGRIDIARRFIADSAPPADAGNGETHRPASQTIDLSVVRQALGTKWPIYSDIVHRIAVRTIERHLGRSHGYARQDDGYVLTFTEAEPRAAKDVMRAIAVGLAAALFESAHDDAGSPSRHDIPRRKPRAGGALGPFGWLTRRAKRNGHDDESTAKPGAPDRFKFPKLRLRGDGSIATQELLGSASAATIFSATRPIIAADRVAPSRFAPENDISPGRTLHRLSIDDERETADTTAPATPVAASVLDVSVLADEPPAPQGTAANGEPHPVSALENAMMAAAARMGQDSQRPSQALSDESDFFYRPMWSVRTNMMAISSCLRLAPSAQTGAESVAKAPRGARGDELASIDHATLCHVQNDCRRFSEAERTTLVSIPVHFATLSDPARRATYLDACRGLPPGARRRVLFEILGLNENTDQTQLIKAVAALKPFATLIFGELPLEIADFTRWKQAGLSSIGVDMQEQPDRTPGDEAELIDRLERFVFFASRNGLRSYVRGLNRLSLAAAAVAAGFDFVEGGIIQDQIEPSDVRSFTLEDLYLQFAAARRAPSSVAS